MVIIKWAFIAFMVLVAVIGAGLTYFGYEYHSGAAIGGGPALIIMALVFGVLVAKEPYP